MDKNIRGFDIKLPKDVETWNIGGNVGDFSPQFETFVCDAVADDKYSVFEIKVFTDFAVDPIIIESAREIFKFFPVKNLTLDWVSADNFRVGSYGKDVLFDTYVSVTGEPPYNAQAEYGVEYAEYNVLFPCRVVIKEQYEQGNTLKGNYELDSNKLIEAVYAVIDNLSTGKNYIAYSLEDLI